MNLDPLIILKTLLYFLMLVHAKVIHNQMKFSLWTASGKIFDLKLKWAFI